MMRNGSGHLKPIRDSRVAHAGGESVAHLPPNPILIPAAIIRSRICGIGNDAAARPIMNPEGNGKTSAIGAVRANFGRGRPLDLMKGAADLHAGISEGQSIEGWLELQPDPNVN